jgi:predicted metal-dependent hydrolase
MTQSPSVVAWPPLYKIRKHRLAKYVKLRASTERGLEITVPIRFNPKEIPLILEENKNWILKQLSKLQIKKIDTLPEHIALHAINQTWRVYYVECDSKFEMIARPNQEIVLVGHLHDKQFCQDKLIHWVKNVAKEYLSSQIELLSRQTELDFNSLTIRDQHTLWGSCTAKKSISLNYKLIFMPHRLLQYVIIHELCHTQHLNHSERFWNQVAMYDPAWRAHRHELRHANHYIPNWVRAPELG